VLKFTVISSADPLPILVICNSNESGPICAIDPFKGFELRFSRFFKGGNAFLSLPCIIPSYPCKYCGYDHKYNQFVLSVAGGLEACCKETACEQQSQIISLINDKNINTHLDLALLEDKPH
jgi:hypothetical protein